MRNSLGSALFGNTSCALLLSLMLASRYNTQTLVCNLSEHARHHCHSVCTRDFEANLEYMWRKYGFYLPDAQYLADPEGLLKYLVRAHFAIACCQPVAYIGAGFA